MKTKTELRHQGDVQLAASGIPKSAKKIARKPVALGEHSGHQHIVTGDCEMFEEGDTLYVEVGSEGALLQHIHESVLKGRDYAALGELPIADHKAIKLEPGTSWKIGIHKKYSPFAKVWENVID